MAIDRSSQQWPDEEAIDLTLNYGMELPVRTLVERVCEVVDWWTLQELRRKVCQQ